VQVPVNALIGPLIAVVSFVCSIGNVPMAAVLWGSGISFGGVLAFLYADLIVIPLLDAYRRYFGWRMAAYIAAVFYATMVIASLLMDVAFTGLGLVPQPNPDIRAEMTSFSPNYTFWLNLIFGALAAYLFWLNWKYPMHYGHAPTRRRPRAGPTIIITRRNHLERRTMRARILMARLAAIPVAASAHADAPASPYAGQQARSIKALSPEDIDELRNGAGMGLAKAAELNGYPGPLHVLALTTELRLTPDQVRQVTDIRERMSAAAKPLGGEIIDREQELDRLFAQGQITPGRLRRRPLPSARCRAVCDRSIWPRISRHAMC